MAQRPDDTEIVADEYIGQSAPFLHIPQKADNLKLNAPVKA
jgi:hypothetical protein